MGDGVMMPVDLRRLGSVVMVGAALLAGLLP
jgi:hypothetical protein